jgi:hypothetical protein
MIQLIFGITIPMTLAMVHHFARRYPKYMQKDLVLEGSLYVKCYKGHMDALPLLLRLHMCSIASELREVAITMDLETAEKQPWAHYYMKIDDLPTISFICENTSWLPRTSYRIRNALWMKREDYLP